MSLATIFRDPEELTRETLFIKDYHCAGTREILVKPRSDHDFIKRCTKIIVSPSSDEVVRATAALLFHKHILADDLTTS